MLLHSLVRHPDSPSAAVERIDVQLAADARGMQLSYGLIGDARRVIATAAAAGEPPQRRDELWRTTCCELFVRDAEGDGYLEFNFAPSGDWAAYRFGGYRTGRVPLETPAPRIALERSSAAVTLGVTLRAPALDGLHNLERRIGLACVVETATEISYWALAHAPGKPDFHHPAAFALAWPATPRAAHF
ncbi:MAG TPA: DOMON-like domain-containing protein, partial [Gammaproteobacteria bacterium]|nr:DOMON-like domain-containing protein [Gammaproteobacteria bacterium]